MLIYKAKQLMSKKKIQKYLHTLEGNARGMQASDIEQVFFWILF